MVPNVLSFNLPEPSFHKICEHGTCTSIYNEQGVVGGGGDDETITMNNLSFHSPTVLERWGVMCQMHRCKGLGQYGCILVYYMEVINV